MSKAEPSFSKRPVVPHQVHIEFCSQGCVVPGVAPCCTGLEMIALNWPHSWLHSNSALKPREPDQVVSFSGFSLWLVKRAYLLLTTVMGINYRK